MSEVKDKLIKIQGGVQYLQVQDRVLWLREEHPAAQIITDMVQLDMEAGRVVVKATVVIPDGGTATAYGSAVAATLQRNKEKYIEYAETRAVGRALAFLGYSTAGAQDLDEDDLADAPRQQPNGQRPTLDQRKEHVRRAVNQLGWKWTQVQELAAARKLPTDHNQWTLAQADELLAALQEKLGELQPA